MILIFQLLKPNFKEEKMKIRKGFVSNSSSTSFMIYGICLGDKNMEEQDEIEEAIEGSDLAFHRGQCDDDVYVGRDYSSIKDDETGAQFKQDVEEKLKELNLLGDHKCGHHEEAWYNG